MPRRPPMKDTKLRARQEILHYVLSFCISHRFHGDKRVWPSHEGFVSNLDCRDKVKIGDLVILTSAPSSKYTIGWLKDIDTRNPHTYRYLIESLEDGSQCWWHNVGLEYFPRDKIDPSWRWTDRQWAFKDRWWRVCYKEKDAYITLPLFPEFGTDCSVTLGVRTRFGFDDITPSRTFPDWRKVTKAMMAQCYDDLVAEQARIRGERKAAHESVA